MSSGDRVALTAQHAPVVTALTVFSPDTSHAGVRSDPPGWVIDPGCLLGHPLRAGWWPGDPSSPSAPTPPTPSRSRACVSAPVLAAEMENKDPWEGAGSGVAVPAGAVPVQVVPGVPAHSLPPPVFPRESRIPEDSYARMSRWPGMPAASSSPFPEVPSGCIHMAGPAGKQNLCLLDNTHAWHHSGCQGVMFIRHIPGISWVARCLEAGSMP